MGIAFHCEHCGKKIEAPDDAGGRWGKCPVCHNRVYVPGKQADDELRLAPLDNEDERKQKELIAETIRLREDILSETEAPEERAAAKGGPAGAKPGTLSDAELTTSIIDYLRQMANGELEEAERTARTIIPCGSRAVRVLERIAISKAAGPKLASIPRQVLSGLIKNLRSRLR